MSEIIIGQVRFLLMASLLGMALMVAYDVCRFLRWLIPHHRFVVALGDILFWTAVSVPAYGLFFIYNDGEIRWYGALAVLLGCLLYEKGISMPLRRLADYYLSIPRRKFIRLLGRWKRRCTEGVKRGRRKIAQRRQRRKEEKINYQEEKKLLKDKNKKTVKKHKKRCKKYKNRV